MAQEDPDVN